MYKGSAAYPHADKQGQHGRPIRNTRRPRSEENKGTHAADNVQLNGNNTDYNLRINECPCLHVSVNLCAVSEARRCAPAAETSSRWDKPEGKMYKGSAAYPHADKQGIRSLSYVLSCRLAEGRASISDRGRLPHRRYGLCINSITYTNHGGTYACIRSCSLVCIYVFQFVLRPA
jgi:hypothetical protein